MQAVKITKSLEYKLIVSNGKKINSHNFNLNYKKSDYRYIRIGITTSKKIGNAVKRNLVKRRIKALFFKLLSTSNLYTKDYVIIGKKGILSEKFDNLYEELKLIFNKIEK